MDLFFSRVEFKSWFDIDNKWTLDVPNSDNEYYYDVLEQWRLRFKNVINIVQQYMSPFDMVKILKGGLMVAFLRNNYIICAVEVRNLEVVFERYYNLELLLCLEFLSLSYINRQSYICSEQNICGVLVWVLVQLHICDSVLNKILIIIWHLTRTTWHHDIIKLMSIIPNLF